MILGYEQPVDIPMMSMYDKDMMKMYLGALQRDYEQGVADQKEFIKNYGDFYSNLPGLNEAFYNEGLGKVEKVYNDLMARGIDPLRSSEGRAALAMARNSINIPALAQMKASSRNYDQYLQNRGELERKGLYDAELEKYRGVDPNNFNPYQLWTETSPLERTTTEALMAPLIEQLKNQYRIIPEESKNGIITKGVDNNRIKGVMDNAMKDWENDVRYRYLRDQTGLSKEDFENSILESAYRKLGKQTEVDPQWEISMKEKQLALQKQKLAQDAANHREQINQSERNAWISAGIDPDTKQPLKKEGTNDSYMDRSITHAFASTLGVDLRQPGASTEKLATAQYAKVQQYQKGTSWKTAAWAMSHYGSKNDFIARLSPDEASTYSKNGGKINIGLMLGADRDTFIKRLRTTEDISANMYGSRSKGSYRTTSNNSDSRYNGFSSDVMYTIEGKQYMVNDKKNKYTYHTKERGWNPNMDYLDKVQSIKPVDGAHAMITSIEKDGTLHQYQQVDVTVNNGNNKSTYRLWYDYGDVSSMQVGDISAPGRSATDAWFQKNAEQTGYKPIEQLFK